MRDASVLVDRNRSYGAIIASIEALRERSAREADGAPIESVQLVDRYLWDQAAGLYFDYNVQTGQRRPYPFATTFYPLWAGMSSPRQARQVVGNLARFEAPGGILTSTETSGSQWDAPFGWGPLQLMAVGGLRRYGYQAHADRIARKFVSLVVQDFDAHHAIVEKYDVRRRSSDLAAGLKEQAAAYAKVTTKNVIMAYHLVATIAQGLPGKDEKYRECLDDIRKIQNMWDRGSSPVMSPKFWFAYHKVLVFWALAALIGLAWRRRWEVLPIGLTVLGITVIGGLLLAVPRRALPLMPFVLALAGVTIAWLGAAVPAYRRAILPRARWSSARSESSASASRPA